MSYVFQSGHKRPAESRPARRWAVVLRRAMGATGQRLARAWRYAAARREFNRLDDSALRDLGIGRCEFGSYWAETHGEVEPTRLRVTRDLGPDTP